MKRFLAWWDRTIGPIKIELLTVDFNSVSSLPWIYFQVFTVEYRFKDRSLFSISHCSDFELELFFFKVIS